MVLKKKVNTKKVLSETHKGWDTKEHLQEFDHWNKMNNLEFLFKYGCFEEQKYLKEQFTEFDNPSILDFGCATGTTNKFLKLISKNKSFKYLGVDISQAAIKKAKMYYQENEFKVIEEKSDFLNKNKFDIVYSRDTVLHQQNPYEFIGSLLGSSKKALILRLRTRDYGDTVLDIKNSCQLNYEDFWMPYIVLNFDELIDFLLDHEKVASIKVNRSYMVLGGQNNRYLPKDLFYKKTGTSETSLLIKIYDGKEKRKKNIIIENNIEGQNYLFMKRRKALLLRIISLITKNISWIK